MLLILDLDEALLFATDKPRGVAPELRAFDCDIYGCQGLQACVRHVSRLFPRTVWTSST